MKKFDYLTFYPSDFFGDNNVALMNGWEQGVYICLLMRMWGTPEQYKIPHDDGIISRLLTLTIDEWKTVKPAIMRCLTEQDGYLISCRLQKEKEYAEKTHDQASASARKRWQKFDESRHMPTASAGRHIPPSPSPSPYKKKKNIYGEEVFGMKPDPEKKKYLEATYLKQDQYDKLQKKLGAMAWKCIEKLDSYKMAHRRHYESDYHAILNWVVPQVEEEQKKNPNRNIGGNRTMVEKKVATVCQKCDTPAEVVEHRGMRICGKCLKEVAPEINDKLADVLSKIGKRV